MCISTEYAGEGPEASEIIKKLVQKSVETCNFW